MTSGPDLLRLALVRGPGGLSWSEAAAWATMLGLMSMTTQTTADANGVGPGRGGRMSRQRKREAVLRLLRGEDLELVSRSLGVTAATLSGWREAFLAGGEASLTVQRQFW